MRNKSNIVTSAADGCGNPSSIRPMDHLPSRDHKGAEYKESFMFSNRSSVSRSSVLAIAAFAAVALIGLASIASASTISLPTPLVDYAAANYNAATGVWADSSGNGNNAVQSVSADRPTLLTDATPNGSAAVSFNGSQYLNITTPLSPQNGFTVLAFLDPTAESSSNVILGVTNSNPGSFEYRLNGGKQDILEATYFDLGSSDTVVPVNSWNNINVAANTSGSSFRLNSQADGTAGGYTPSSNGTGVIGASEYDGDFIGNIAEIRVYGSVLSGTQRAAIEQSFVNDYVTPIPDPVPLALFAFGGFGLLLLRCRHRRLA